MSGDILYLQTADGKQLFVPDDELRFLTYGNFGAPGVNFLTARGYLQHGQTEIGYLLEPRTVSIQLWRSPACTRQVYWDNRLALHEFLRHNRGGLLRFVLRQPNGEERALLVRANPGLQFPMPGVEDNNWDVNESIDFLAHDPIWFDPDAHVQTVLSTQVMDLIFPITFPIRFGTTSYDSAVSITYPGTWVSYPIITLYGPYQSALLENTATGVRILMAVPVAGGDRRIITLTPGQQSIVDAMGRNCFGDLDITSDLTGFNIRPDPEVRGGIQTIKATFLGGAAGTSAMKLDYTDKYFAL